MQCCGAGIPGDGGLMVHMLVNVIQEIRLGVCPMEMRLGILWKGV